MYSQSFYERRQTQKELAAKVVFDRLLPMLPPVGAAVDVGCGVGTWLAELASRSAEVVGLDGAWVDEARLRIPRSAFRRVDLAGPIRLDRRFDLAVSLEVAEHLPRASAATFVESLTALADVVLFSAAIPGQGGTGHVNEQWPDEWIGRFAYRGFGVADVLRSALWNDERLPYWYRQNAFVFVSETALDRMPAVLREAVRRGPEMPLRAVHPVLFDEKRRGPVTSIVRRVWGVS